MGSILTHFFNSNRVSSQTRVMNNNDKFERRKARFNPYRKRSHSRNDEGEFRSYKKFKRYHHEGGREEKSPSPRPSSSAPRDWRYVKDRQFFPFQANKSRRKIIYRSPNYRIKGDNQGMALSLRRGASWSQVCLGRPNLASKLHLTTLSPVVWHRIVLDSSLNSHGLSTDPHRPVTGFSVLKVNLRGISNRSSSTKCGVDNNNYNNNNNIVIGGNDENIRTTGIIKRNKGRCMTGSFSELHRSLYRFNSAFVNPVSVRLFRTWEPSNKALYAKKPGGDMSSNNNLKVDPMSTPDSSKKSPGSGGDSPDSMGSSASVKSTDKPSPQGIQREDMAPNEREQQQPMWKIKKEKYLNESLQERRKRGKTLLEHIETWPEYYSGKERENDRKVTKGSIKSICPELNSKVSMWKGDITSLVIDAIVNAANESLMGGGGVDGAIHSASGRYLKEECKIYKRCLTGRAVITGGYELPAKYVIHTVGPRGEDSDKLRSCYENSLDCLLETGLKSVAFPCVSTGIYGYPNDKAAEVVLKTVRDWLEKNHEKVERVIFCLFLEKDIRIYEEKMQQYFPLSSSELGKAGHEESKEKPPKEM